MLIQLLLIGYFLTYIFESNSDYEKLDAFNAQFKVEILANSKKEINFKARIKKN